MALTGNEVLQVLGVDGKGQPAATTEQTTTGAIAALASTESSPIVNTAITTAGAGTLTAAGLVGGLITRTGPTGDFSDATDTAVAIVAALPGFIAGETFLVRIKNATAFTETITAGAGVTLPATVLIPAFSIGNYYATAVSATAVTLTHINTVPITSGKALTSLSSTALSTVGAGVITAAGFNTGVTVRTGSTVAFTDTTDTADNIIAANAAIINKIGTSFIYRYVNNTVAAATIAGGTGVTVSGATVVPANAWIEYLVTYTAASTLTMVALAQGYFAHSGTFTNNGASTVTTADTNVTAGSEILITLKTVGGTVGAIPHLLTITPGTGFATVGTASDTSVYNYTILG